MNVQDIQNMISSCMASKQKGLTSKDLPRTFHSVV